VTRPAGCNFAVTSGGSNTASTVRSDLALLFASLLPATLVLAAAAEWKPLSKGDAMKALFATALAALLGFAALSLYAAPLPASTDLQAPLPSDEDKDKDKDKKGD
jgi:hypothetical protein